MGFTFERGPLLLFDVLACCCTTLKSLRKGRHSTTGPWDDILVCQGFFYLKGRLECLNGAKAVVWSGSYKCDLEVTEKVNKLEFCSEDMYSNSEVKGIVCLECWLYKGHGHQIILIYVAYAHKVLLLWLQGVKQVQQHCAEMNVVQSSFSRHFRKILWKG